MENTEKSSIPKNRLRNSIIAYIDFLGTKANMSKGEEYLKDINELYSDAIGLITSQEDASLPKINYRSFSDNIVFSIDFPKNATSEADKNKVKQAFDLLFRLVSAFQNAALRKKYLVRGGIAIGDFYLNNQLVWGTSLSSAVLLEENVAIYPRIVISEEIKNLTWETIYAGRTFLTTDKDGIGYVNFLANESFEDYRGIYNHFSVLERNEPNLRIKQKYGWLLSYMESVFHITEPKAE